MTDLIMVLTDIIVIAFVGRVLAAKVKNGEIIAVGVMLILFMFLLKMVFLYSQKYKKLLDEATAWWRRISYYFSRLSEKPDSGLYSQI